LKFNDNDHLNNCFKIIISLHLPLKIDSNFLQYKIIWLGIATMLITHYCLFDTQSAADFPKAVNFYMAILTETLMNDIKEICQESASIIKGDSASDKLFNILIKNVLN